MAVKAAALETELIDAVCARVRERLPEDQARPCESFVRQYYRWVPAEDLAERDPLDLYGAALQHCTEMQRRAAGAIKVEVYNPTFEHHGWQSPHTVVEIVTRRYAVPRRLGDDGARARGAPDPPRHPSRHPRAPGRRRQPARRPRSGRRSDRHRRRVRAPRRDRRGSPIPAGQEHLQRQVERVLREVHAAVADWHAMRGRAETLIGEIDEREPPGLDPAGLDEAKAFLHWLDARALHVPRLPRVRARRRRRGHRAEGRPRLRPRDPARRAGRRRTRS